MMSGNNKSLEEVLLELEKALPENAELKARLGNSGSGEGLLEFENYFDAAGDPSSFLDSNYTYQAVNAAYSRYFGLEKQLIVGASVADIVGTETFATVLKPAMDRCLHGEHVTFEQWIDFPAMGRRYMSIGYSPRRNSQGEIIGILHISRDQTEHKLKDVEIQQERDKFSGILASLDTGLSVINPDLTVDWVNNQIHRMFPEGDPIGRVCHEFYEGQQEPCEGCPTMKVFETGDAHHHERYSEKDGRWYSVLAQPIRDASGKVVKVLEGITDITERKQSEKELKEKTSLLEAILDNTPDIMSIKRPDLSVIRYNKAGYSFLNKSLEQIKSAKCFELIGRNSPCQPCATQETVKTKQPVTLEKYVPELDMHLSCRVNPILSDNGQVEYTVELIRDITEPKKVEEALLESEALLNAVGQMVNAGGWKLDAEMQHVWWTEQTYRIHGLPLDYHPTVEEALSFYHPDDRMKLSEALQHTRETGKPLDEEYRFTNAHGDPRWVRVICQPQRKEGRLHKFNGVFQDITERKQAEAALLESERRIRKKLDTILQPDSDLGELDLTDIIDHETFQALMNEFYTLTKIGVAIVDMKGKVLVATGWQDICTRFHRVHSETAERCRESDLYLSNGVEPGEFKLYRCKNNMWDIATPFMVGGRKVGNLFLGQFIFKDEEPDRELFRQQARQYGFDEDDYLAALDRVPRWNRDTVDTVMRFYSTLANLIATLSFGNIKLAWSIAEKESLIDQLRTSEERLFLAVEMAHMGHWEMDTPTMTFTFNEQFYSLYGTTSEQEHGFTMSAETYAEKFVHPDDSHMVANEITNVITGGHNDRPVQLEHRIVRKDGDIRYIVVRYTAIKNNGGVPIKTIGVNQDITERKRSEDEFARQGAFINDLLDALPDLAFCKTPDGVYLTCNKEFARHVGLEKKNTRLSDLLQQVTQQLVF
jgi:PAS domain S-box-containing protein